MNQAVEPIWMRESVEVHWDKAGNCYRCGEVGRCHCSRKQLADHLSACIQGCTGLNPAAYRECVEALKDALNYWEPACKENCEKGYHANEAKAYAKSQQAVRHAERRPPNDPITF